LPEVDLYFGMDDNQGVLEIVLELFGYLRGASYSVNKIKHNKKICKINLNRRENGK